MKKGLRLLAAVIIALTVSVYSSNAQKLMTWGSRFIITDLSTQHMKWINHKYMITINFDRSYVTLNFGGKGVFSDKIETVESFKEERTLKIKTKEGFTVFFQGDNVVVIDPDDRNTLYYFPVSDDNYLLESDK